MASLVEEWLARLEGAAVAELSTQAAMFPELAHAYTPPGLQLLFLEGSNVARDGDDNVVVDFNAILIPTGADPDDPEVSVGNIVRRVSTRDGYARHTRLEIPDGYRGMNRGRSLTAATVSLYDRLGVEGIGLTAIAVGRYVWAMCGFSFAGGCELVRSVVVEFCYELGYELDEQEIREPWDIGYYLVGRDEPEPQITYEEILEVAGTSIDPGALSDTNETMRLGKAALLYAPFQAWEGRLDLRPGSMGRMLLSSYTGVEL